MAVILGAPLSGFILSMTGELGGLRDWQWLFLIEAVPPVILGLVMMFYLPNTVDEASWLLPQEKKTARAMLAADLNVRKQTARIKFRQVFSHSAVLSLALIFLAVTTTNVTASFWLPQMIKQRGFSTQATGLLTAIPYIAGVAGLLLWGRHSDRTGVRRWHVIGPLMVAACGVALAAISADPVARIVGFTLSVSSLFAVLPVFWTLPPQLMVGAAAAAGIAVINSVGNLGGFIGPAVMGYVMDRTGSFSGGLALQVVVLLAAAALACNVVRDRPG